MGTSANASQLAGKLTSAAQAVEFGAAAGVREAAVTGKVIFLAALPSRTMRNVGKGAKLGARFDIKGFKNPVALVRYTGPAHLLNNRTGTHIITARGNTRTARGNRRRGAKVLKFASDEFASGAVRHPGTPGKYFFQTKALPALRAAAPKAIRRGVRQRMAQVF